MHAQKLRVQTHAKKLLLGSGRMPHPVGGAMGVTLCHDDMNGMIHPVVASSH